MRAGYLLLTTQLVSALLAIAVTACCSCLVWAHWVIPTTKERNTAVRLPLGGKCEHLLLISFNLGFASLVLVWRWFLDGPCLTAQDIQ